MNFLGHQLLSYPDHGLMVGNFLGDFVKGTHWQSLPVPIARGVLMHREIDHYTDRHPDTHALVSALRPACGKYASVISDIVIDHILAVCWKEYADIPLADFSLIVYETIGKHQNLLNEKALFTFSWMKSNNWLFNYSTIAGLQKSLLGMSRRTGSVYDFTKSIPIISNEKELFFKLGRSFINDITNQKDRLISTIQLT